MEISLRKESVEEIDDEKTDKEEKSFNVYDEIEKYSQEDEITYKKYNETKKKFDDIKPDFEQKKKDYLEKKEEFIKNKEKQDELLKLSIQEYRTQIQAVNSCLISEIKPKIHIIDQIVKQTQELLEQEFRRKE